jgi:hypothetical protein
LFVLQVFDAVVVANGHYSEPNLPDVPGAGSWPGLQLHSHNYRVPEAFKDQVVVVVGASNSGRWILSSEIKFGYGGLLSITAKAIHKICTVLLFWFGCDCWLWWSISTWASAGSWPGLQLHSQNYRYSMLVKHCGTKAKALVAAVRLIMNL